jgi:glycosyltransferase involved in cell wall biosynthesis
MRYLLYTETFPSRRPDSPRQTGIGRYCADLAAGLAGLGHEVAVVTNDELDGAADAHVPYAVRTLGPRPRGIRHRWERRRRVLAIARELAPNYLLVGDTVAHRVLGPGGAPRWPYCPFLYGTELVGWHEGGMLGRWRARRYLRSARAPVCISRYTHGLLRELLPGADRACLVHPCVTDLFLSRPPQTAFASELRCRVTGEGPTPLVVVTVARISERKNQLGVLRALEQLRRTTGVPFHYFIVGNVDAGVHRGYFEEVRAFIAAHDLTDSVTIVGNTTDERKIDYIDAADVVVMLSRRVGASVEGFGITAIVGSCRGRPVVVSDHGGMPETIVEGVTGFAVPPDDPARAAEALHLLARDPQRRREMGDAGRRFAHERFTPAAAAARLHTQLLERAARRETGARTR